MSFTKTTAAVKSVIGHKGFGFLKDESDIVIFIHATVLEEAGFVKKDLLSTSTIMVEVSTATDGRRTAKRVLELDGKKAKLSSKRQPVQATMTLDVFFQSTKVDCNKETGECIWKITNKFGEFVQYVVADENRFVIRQLGNATLAAARSDINRVISHSVAEGGKTNDPALSQRMQGSSSGSKKKAA